MDHSTYLLPRGSADVFFPTRFQMLERMYEYSARSPAGELILISIVVFLWDAKNHLDGMKK